MRSLPSGWAGARLADVADLRLGRQRSPKRATGERMRPYLRAANVGWQGLKLDDVKEMDFSEAESATYGLRPGDLLLAEASGSAGEVGKPGQFRGEIDDCCFQNTLIRVRLPEGLLPDFYEHFFRHEAMSRRFADGSRGVGIHHLGAATLSNWWTPIPPTAEQERIVAAIEEAFSLLDAGETALHNTRTRLRRMRDSVLTAAVTGQLVPQDPTDSPAAEWLAGQGLGQEASPDVGLPPSWRAVRLGGVAEVRLGRQRSPGRASGPRMRPYLRAANVGWGGLKLDDVKEMDFTESESAAYELMPGDLLLSEASGSPGEVGKPGQYRGEIEGCCFQNTLIRVRLRHGWNPDFYEHYFRQQARAGKFAEGSRGVGIHHLGRQALSDWLTPVPPPEEQARIVAEVERQLSFIEAADRAVDAGLARSKGLRRSVLKAAFEGQLVEQDPADEPASVFLERVGARRNTGSSKRGRRAVSAPS